MQAHEIATKAKLSTRQLLGKTEADRQRALKAIADQLMARQDELLAINQMDVTRAKETGLTGALLERLTLTAKIVASMSQACLDIAHWPQVVNKMVEEYERPNGLMIQKVRIPLGVIGMIFESRPNVVIDGAALAIKSGNAIVLKGGSEAQGSNRFLIELVREAITPYLPVDSIAMVETREDIATLLQMNDCIDLMVPRGGEKLIRYVKENATMPVVAHDQGLCHVYLHKDAVPEQAMNIVLNAKTQRPGVCNAMETLLVHQEFPTNELVKMVEALKSKGVEIYACPRAIGLSSQLLPASDKEFSTEWLELKMSLKIVDNQQEAIAHIQKFGSHHTEAVLSRDPKVIEEFMNNIDASCIAINASTRFNDGAELGLGAELGISTTKFHAYGPMGAKEMTTTRFVVRGQGHVRL